MKIIQQNPYRILGLIVGSSARVQDNQIKNLRQYIDAEQDPPEDFSFPSLGKFERSINNVNDAAQKLNLDHDKIHAGLFWFYNGNAITDEPAFDALKNGEIKEAVAIWGNLVVNKNLSAKNASAHFNWATLYLNAAFAKKDLNESHLKKGVELKLKLLDSEFFDDFLARVTDQTAVLSKNDLQLLFLNEIFHEVETSNNGSSQSFIEILRNLDFSAKADFTKSLVQKPIDLIEKQVADVKSHRITNMANASKLGYDLFSATQVSLNLVKSLLGESNIKYASIADKVANGVLQCSIDYFNHHHKIESSNNYFDEAMKLARLSQSIAEGKLTKDRIQDSLDTLDQMKDRVITKAIEFLQSVKEAFEENEQEIRQEVKKIENTDIDIILGHKSINWDAVEVRINNSINWSNVNDYLTKALRDENLSIIRHSDKLQQKNEFLKLANWLKDKSTNNSLITSIIDKYNKIPPKLPFKIISSEILNTDKNNRPLVVTDPMYNKYTRYVGLKLEVECYDSSSVTFHLVYTKRPTAIDSIMRSFALFTGSKNDTVKERKKIELTRTIKIEPSTKYISLSGMGNDSECTFSLNDHFIHVYVEDFLLHTKQFTVSLSPSEIYEMQLKDAVEHLEKIKNTQYFETELKSLHDQLLQIKEWKFGRSSSTKDRQIDELQKKIISLMEKSEREKETKMRDQRILINNLKELIQQEPY